MKNFLENGFFTGINYWGSKSAINMWSEFDAESIENDLSLLRDAKITHLRVFPLWSVFQPLHALYGPSNIYEYTFGEDPLPDTPAGRAGVSEEACQKFEKFCAIAEKYGMKLIVALITGHMSFRTYNPPAFDGKALLSDPTVIKWQLRFVKYFVSRFKQESSIVGWDLGNEACNMPGMTNNPDSFYVWCSSIADAIRVSDPTRPVISGLDRSSIDTGSSSLKMIGEICDIHTTHPYNVFSTQGSPLTTSLPILDLPFKCRLGEDVGGIPTFVQEFGSVGYMNCSKKTEADFYRAALLTSLAHGCHGTMWWCAFDQGHHSYAPYRWNTIGSQYGFFDKDLNAKPLVKENKDFCALLEKLPNHNLPIAKTDGVILIPREESPSTDLLRATYATCKQVDLNMGFSYLLDPIPDSPLYIIPSIKGNKSIPKNRLDELLCKVRSGSVLYLCADTGLLRDLPTISGVEFAYREKICEKRTLTLGEHKLPISTEYFYKPETISADVVGRDEDGEAVFFKNKFGEGYIYTMTLPLESYMASTPKIFHDPNAPAYREVYKEIARAANIEKLCYSSDPFVMLTEHYGDDGEIYVFAINYHNRATKAHLSIKEGYAVETLYGSQLQNGILELKENDGALLKAKRICE